MTEFTLRHYRWNQLSIALLLCILISITASSALANRYTVGFVTGAAGLGDMSYNDMVYGGLRKAQQETGFKLIIHEPAEDGSVSNNALLSVIAQCDVVVLAGYQYRDFITTFAPRFQETRFIYLEAAIDNLPNVASIVFRQHEPAYLAGILASRMSLTGNVAFIGGSPLDSVKGFAWGFEQGIRSTRNNVQLTVRYLSQSGEYAGFNSPKKGYETALELFAKDVDIIFTVASVSGNGVIEAVRTHPERYAIGADANQDLLARGRVLTSVIKRLDLVCYETVMDCIKGRFNAGVTQRGMADGAMELSEMQFTKDLIPPAVLEEIQQARNDILSGRLHLDNPYSQTRLE